MFCSVDVWRSVQEAITFYSSFIQPRTKTYQKVAVGRNRGDKSQPSFLELSAQSIVSFQIGMVRI